MSALAKPFAFSDFAAPSEALADQPEARVDVDAVRRAGFEAGVAESDARRAACEVAAIEAIAEKLAGECAVFDEGLVIESQSLRAAAHAFLARFAENLSATREVEMAASLVDRLLAASNDRASARLEVSPEAFDRIAAPLEVALARRTAEDFIELAAAQDLSAGDTRLTWRGGVAERRLADAIAALDTAFAPDSPDFPAPRAPRRSPDAPLSIDIDPPTEETP